MNTDAIKVFLIAKSAFDSGVTKSYEFRKQQLEALLKLYEDNRTSLEEVLYKDLRKCKEESTLLEINYLINDVKTHIFNLKSWMKPEKTDRDLANKFDDLKILKEPFGVVLVIGSWNYPLQVTLAPVASAIAAGNCVIIKPSEISTACTSLMVKLIPKYLDNNCYHVFEANGPETLVLLQQKFDYIFFTGSTAVGKIVHQEASKNLIPTTLELGGKSPLYLDDVHNMDNAVKRILWGKILCSGQTCIAPDYILCSESVQEKFIKSADKIIKDFLGKNAQDSPYYCRIINDRHFQRIKKFLNDGQIALGGLSDENERFMQFTILVNVKSSDSVMQEEIFGPILPIIKVKNVEEAISFITAREKPLSLYIFTDNNKVRDLIVNNTSSGGVCVNDTLMHVATKYLPFGGVGHSGMGNYHGKYGFDTFSHKKSYLSKSLSNFQEQILALRYPPYVDWKMSVMNTVVKERGQISFSFLPYLLLYVLGILTAYIFAKYVFKSY